MAGKSTIFTKFLKDVNKRNKSIAGAGGGKPGKRIKVTPTIGKKKKKK